MPPDAANARKPLYHNRLRPFTTSTLATGYGVHQPDLARNDLKTSGFTEPQQSDLELINDSIVKGLEK